MKLNNKGFTLIELLATIILLSLITTVTTIAVVNIIDSSKENSYEILISNIKTASEALYEECDGNDIIKSEISDQDVCTKKESNYCLSNSLIPDSCIEIKIGDLLTYGFLKSSATDSNNNKIITNPKTDESMNECKIGIGKKSSGSNDSVWYEFFNPNESQTESQNDSCPTSDDLK